MDGDRPYSLRTRSSAASGRRGASSSSSTDESSRSARASSAGWTTTTTSTTTRSRMASPGMRTPEPVQRTLDLRSLGAFEEDEDGFGALRRPTYRSSLYRQHEDDDLDEGEDEESEALDEEEDEFEEEDELLDDEDEEDEGEHHRLRTRRPTLKRRAASAAAFFNRRSAVAASTCMMAGVTRFGDSSGQWVWILKLMNTCQFGCLTGISQQVASWPVVKKISKYFRRFWVSTKMLSSSSLACSRGGRRIVSPHWN